MKSAIVAAALFTFAWAAPQGSVPTDPGALNGNPGPPAPGNDGPVAPPTVTVTLAAAMTDLPPTFTTETILSAATTGTAVSALASKIEGDGLTLFSSLFGRAPISITFGVQAVATTASSASVNAAAPAATQIAAGAGVAMVAALVGAVIAL